MPTTVPITNAITVVTPTSPSVQGSFDVISVITGTPWAVIPNWPVRQFPRYCEVARSGRSDGR